MMNVESTKDKRVWHSGPPPFVGWWNASLPEYTSPFMWRWWDGERWSSGVVSNADPDEVLFKSRVPGTYDTTIVWTDYWPENAACPRLNPDQSSTIWKGKVWAWVDGELVSHTEKFRSIFESLPSLDTIVCPDHKFVDTKALEDELQNISGELADIEDKVTNIVYCLGRVRKVLRGE